MNRLEPRWMDEDDALNAIRRARDCSDLSVLEAYLATAKVDGVAARHGKVNRDEFLGWLEKSFRGTGRRPGPVPKYDWDGMVEESHRHVRDGEWSGLQADLERHLIDWFRMQNQHPDQSEIRRHLPMQYRKQV